jgi:sterol desaturase/sphingolipid hydroxylase (fatty acid hydroxylase superfamily)
VHHSQIVEETYSNYASILSLWDRIFQSCRYSQTPEAIKIGLMEESRELNILNLLTLPFSRDLDKNRG